LRNFEKFFKHGVVFLAYLLRMFQRLALVELNGPLELRGFDLCVRLRGINARVAEHRPHRLEVVERGSIIGSLVLVWLWHRSWRLWHRSWAASV
jgi:hypothetical protein